MWYRRLPPRRLRFLHVHRVRPIPESQQQKSFVVTSTPSAADRIEHRHVACTRCACVCDDLTVVTQGGRVVEIEHDCPLSHDWFLRQTHASGAIATHRGTPVALEVAVRSAAELIAGARAPLIFGLSHSSTDGQRAAVSLADRLRATIDTSASQGHAPSIVAFQQVGESTSSLGEVRERADLVIYWGANPLVSHPRHWSRYAVEPTSPRLPRGRADRYVVVIDVEESETSRQSDEFIRVAPEGDFGLLWALRAAVRGTAWSGAEVAGVPADVIERLAARMRGCQSGAVFFGYGIARQPTGARAVEALLQLVTDLNEYTRFYARRMRVSGDVSGADSVLCWQTGYPFSVSFATGYPRYSPGEFSAEEVLLRGETDCVLVVGTDLLGTLPDAAVERLQETPTIFLASVGSQLPCPPTVEFRTAVHGIHCGGTAYRMDEMPIRLRAILPTAWPTDAHVLSAIEAHVADLASRDHQPSEQSRSRSMR